MRDNGHHRKTTETRCCANSLTSAEHVASYPLVATPYSLKNKKREIFLTFSVGAFAVAMEPDQYVLRVQMRDSGRHGKTIETGHCVDSLMSAERRASYPFFVATSYLLENLEMYTLCIEILKNLHYGYITRTLRNVHYGYRRRRRRQPNLFTILPGKPSPSTSSTELI
jgi:hypothetical protein